MLGIEIGTILLKNDLNKQHSLKSPLVITIIGPESTGKSTLAEDLANHFGTLWVPEFARYYLENSNQPYQQQDLLKIAQGQLLLFNSLKLKEDKILFCDTDIHVIKVWSLFKYGSVDNEILKLIDSMQCDAYILTDIDLPWENDPLRENPDLYERKFLLDWYEQIIILTKKPYLKISGSKKERLNNSISYINTLIQ